MVGESSKVFVAGATGYTGREVVAELTARQVAVIAHIRPGSREGDDAAKRFEAMGASVDRTPWELQAMKAAIEGHAPTVAMALLGTTRKRGAEAAKRGALETYETIDHGLSVMLLDACRGLRPRFVYLSSLGAQSPGRNAYLIARRKTEDAIFASRMPYVIVRPSFISGPDRNESRPGERFASVVGDGALSVLGALGAKGTRDKYRSITAKALAKALVKLALENGDERKIVEADALER